MWERSLAAKKLHWVPLRPCSRWHVLLLDWSGQWSWISSISLHCLHSKLFRDYFVTFPRPMSINNLFRGPRESPLCQILSQMNCKSWAFHILLTIEYIICVSIVQSGFSLGHVWLPGDVLRHTGAEIAEGCANFQAKTGPQLSPLSQMQHLETICITDSYCKYVSNGPIYFFSLVAFLQSEMLKQLRLTFENGVVVLINTQTAAVAAAETVCVSCLSVRKINQRPQTD